MAVDVDKGYVLVDDLIIVCNLQSGSQGQMAIYVEKGYFIVDDQIIDSNLQGIKQKWRISRY